jgi:hypothetical protein
VIELANIFEDVGVVQKEVDINIFLATKLFASRDRIFEQLE